MTGGSHLPPPLSSPKTGTAPRHSVCTINTLLKLPRADSRVNSAACAVAGQIGIGTVWMCTAICANYKLLPTFLVGTQNSRFAESLM